MHEGLTLIFTVSCVRNLRESVTTVLNKIKYLHKYIPVHRLTPFLCIQKIGYYFFLRIGARGANKNEIVFLPTQHDSSHYSQELEPGTIKTLSFSRLKIFVNFFKSVKRIYYYYTISLTRYPISK